MTLISCPSTDCRCAGTRQHQSNFRLYYWYLFTNH